MGGPGSGRYYRDEKTTVDDCRCLDINRMVKLGAIPACGWQSGSWIWTDADTGEEKSRIGYEANTRNPADSFLRVYYTFTQSQKQVDYKVRLSRSQAHYGGERFWFICPSTGKRAAKLYLHPGGDVFASRHAYRLAYKSQSECALARSIRKKWRIAEKIGGNAYYKKPKGMHRKTYERQFRKFLRAEMYSDRLFEQRFGSEF
jgi:hypothetical protein